MIKPNSKNLKKSARNNLMKLSSYLLALRPWSLGTSLMPVLLGCVLAHKVTGEFDIVILTITGFTALSVHAAGNIVNTYFDFVKGIDNVKSNDRTLVDNILTLDEVIHLGVVLYILGCTGFALLVIFSPAKMEYLALIYFGGLSSSFLYTGGIGLKYIALGDILILIIFGPLTVLFSYVTQTGESAWPIILYGIPLALHTEAILHSNNIRHLERDSEANIVTLAIFLGKTLSHVLLAVLLFIPYIIVFIFCIHYSWWFLLPISTLFKAFKFEKEFRSGNSKYIPVMLNCYFSIFYILSCIFTDLHKLPFLETYIKSS